mmetsp:Transcript_30279/g.82832  ORF Transcript_30279/g.82832 Transcript_30279/m.82832 type:complete len:141 (-) Transcript_30279:333-755(-)
MYAMSVAGAWQLDSALRWPPWLRLRCQQLGLGSHPIVAMLLVIALAGACFAAAKPITEYTLILMNPRTRDEIRLRESRGFTRPPSRRPGESTPWQEVATGGFELLPRDLMIARTQRRHHVIFLSLVALYFASRLSQPLSM